MDTKSDEQFLVIKATIESNKKDADKNQMKTDDKLALLTENLQFLTPFMMDQNNNDIDILRGQVTVLSIWILDVIGDHIDAWYCISSDVLVSTV